MPIIQPTPPVAVQISARPDTPPIVVQAFIDPSAAPPGTDPTSIAFGVLCLAVAWNRAVLIAIANRVAMLEIHAAETHHLASSGRTMDSEGGDACCQASQQRLRAATFAITQQAKLLEINQPQPAANDEAAASEGGEESRAPASALDAIDPASLS